MLLNYTPHSINFNDGSMIESSGNARVTTSYTNIGKTILSNCKGGNSFFDHQESCGCDGRGYFIPVFKVEFGKVVGLPDPAPNTFYIVSGVVLQAVKAFRTDCFAPATGHPECVREKGQVVSVPGLV